MISQEKVKRLLAVIVILALVIGGAAPFLANMGSAVAQAFEPGSKISSLLAAQVEAKAREILTSNAIIEYKNLTVTSYNISIEMSTL